VAKVPSEWARNWRTLGLGFTLLTLLVAGPVAGFLIGDWLDRKLGTGWLTWVWLLIGFVAAGRQVYLLARRIQQEMDQPPDPKA
jgi:F0F1-type ATP synthase assembly protein I